MHLRDLSLIVLMTLDLISSAHADTLEHADLRGSTASPLPVPQQATPGYRLFAVDPSYSIAPSAPSYPSPPRSHPPAPQRAQFSGYTFEFGMRLWLGTGQLAKDLFDDPRFTHNLNSRLTYSGLTSAAYEGFG